MTRPARELAPLDGRGRAAAEEHLTLARSIARKASRRFGASHDFEGDAALALCEAASVGRVDDPDIFRCQALCRVKFAILIAVRGGFPLGYRRPRQRRGGVPAREGFFPEDLSWDDTRDEAWHALAVHEAIGRLSPRERQVLGMYRGIGAARMATRQIARSLSITDGAVHGALGKAMKKLRADRVLSQLVANGGASPDERKPQDIATQAREEARVLSVDLPIDGDHFAWIRHVRTGHRLVIRGGVGLSFCGPDMAFLLNGKPLPSFRQVREIAGPLELEWAYPSHPGYSCLTVESMGGSHYRISYNARRWDLSRRPPEGARLTLTKAG